MTPQVAACTLPFYKQRTRAGMVRHWTINGRFLSQPMTGVQRYAHEIVCALDSLLGEQSPLARGLEIELLIPPGAENPLRLEAIVSRTVGRIGGHVWEQAVLPANLNGGGLLSLCNTGPLAARKHIVCVHDANTWNVPRSYSLPFLALYRILLPALGRTARCISTVSNFSLGEITRHRIVSSSRVFVAPNGHEHATRWKPQHSSATFKAATRNTIVLIGSSAPHKNLSFILGMADSLGAAGLRIAVVGMADPHVFKLTSPQTEAGNAVWLGRISDGEFAALLRDSMCLAFPSLTEGFGLPALEAMALGCPVVVSDRASLPEVCGDAALYAAPDDADAWLDRFMQLQNSQSLRLQMIARGRARACAFSWRASAGHYLKAMAEADGLSDDGVATERVHELI
jgi:glycosyltransferase involved in cell wall biosynthesis